MAVKIPQLMTQYKFWFYVRKAIFQGFFPIIVGSATFYDLAKNTSDDNQVFYKHLYVYTGLILFSYGSTKTIFEFIFSVCADDIIFKKEINLENTTADLMLSLRLDDSNSTSNMIIIVKKFFKLRFTNSTFFIGISKICWWLGIDCPILIPYEIIKQLTNHYDVITPDNENLLLTTTLREMFQYHPTKENSIYSVAKATSSDLGYKADERLLGNTQSLLPKNKMDRSIQHIKKQLYGENPPSLSANFPNRISLDDSIEMPEIV